MQGSGTKPSFANCTISGNRATGSQGQGGGVGIVNSASPTFTFTFFTDNFAGAMGGGMHIEGSGTRPLLNNCTISHNQAAKFGGGLCLVSENPNAFSSSCSGWMAEIMKNSATTGGGLFLQLSPTTGNHSESLIEAFCPLLHFDDNTANLRGNDRASSAFRIVVVQQPKHTTMPGAGHTMVMSFSVLDAFGQNCTGENPGEMKIAAIPPLLLHGSLALALKQGHVTIGLSGSQNQLGVAQAHLGQSFRIQASGSGSNTLALPSSVQPAMTDTISVATCSNGLLHCDCSNANCPCSNATGPGDFVCIAHSESHQLSQGVKVLIAVGSLVVLALVILTIYQVRKRRSIELAFSHAKTPLAR